MELIINNVTDVLDDLVGCFRQYILQEPIHLTFISRNLCRLTGYEKEEFEEGADGFEKLVHPSDRQIYKDFLSRIAQKEQTLTAQYRILKKDGVTLYVSDTITSGYTDEGILVGYSVLTDITAIKKENEKLHFLNETVPCGFLKYTCEKNPKITYINEQMIKMLRFPEVKDGESDYLELYKENIYPNLWVPAGICIMLAVLGFNFVGDGLRDAFDPKSKR